MYFRVSQLRDTPSETAKKGEFCELDQATVSIIFNFMVISFKNTQSHF